MSSASSRTQRSSMNISPFRSRKAPSVTPQTRERPNSGRTSTTPSSASASSVSRPPSRLSNSPATLTCTVSPPSFDRPDSTKSKENVCVTVRFRPLSPREINKGDEIAWYADGDYTVRNEHNTNIAYGFDKVFGPATTTRHVYDVAAQRVVSGAMQGINGTVFAYGVTSSGKTHTMHGEQKSPGVIPLAVKDVFGIIQETPGREFLLRVSYLEIYNEVINDLLDSTGQNLRIREDAQGTYVEGIKEEVVLSPAHALSLVATGEEHRHVGSNNFNLLSSRSHTIFTLTIESSPCGEIRGEEDVALSQLNLIDLAGSESSKTETTGLRRKEGSYINKSLLTLGTVISKLTDENATHVPYRDSKLTRLLQSSLSGHGRISLICTLTPASSNSEETHNTLKFAHRSKHVEIKASQNKIMDEKSLIKKYQKEISSLKEELQQLKVGMMEKPYGGATVQEDLVNLKLQMEAGQMKLQSRLEEEEQDKAALMGRIQKLTKLILVSTKNSMPSSVPEMAVNRRRHSFGEDELAYLPDRKREYMIDDDAGSLDSDISAEGRNEITSLDKLVKDYRRNRKRGMLGWFKLKKSDNPAGLSPNSNSDGSASVSPSFSSKSLDNRVKFNESKDVQRNSISIMRDDSSVVDSLPERTQAGDLFSASVGGRRLPSTGTTIADQMDLLREQVKVLAGEVAYSSSSIKRLSEQATSNPGDLQLQEHIKWLKHGVSEKKQQIRMLEQRMIGSVESSPHRSNGIEMTQALSKLATQLNEKVFELEIKSADNRILQEQLQLKISENTEMQETVLLLRRQLDCLTEQSSCSRQLTADNETANNDTFSGEQFEKKNEGTGRIGVCEESCFDETTPTSVMSLNRVFSRDDSKECNEDTFLTSQVLMQAAEIENLKQDKVKIMEEKDGLEILGQKLAEEALYAKELAAAAAVVELQKLAEEVTKLSYQNATLTGDLAAAREACCRTNCIHRSTSSDMKQSTSGARFVSRMKKVDDTSLVEELGKEHNSGYQRETSLETGIAERDKLVSELRRNLDKAKQHEEELENELANMWMLVAKMRKSKDVSLQGVLDLNTVQTTIRNGSSKSNGQSSSHFNGDQFGDNMDEVSRYNEISASFFEERRKCEELESLISRLKGEDITGLDIVGLEELQKLHVEAITNICQAKYANHIR